jgi:hypothetical protein
MSLFLNQSPMGNFYTNFTIFDADIEEVTAAAKELKREAYILKSGNDVVVFDRDCDEQDVEEIEMLGTALSKKLGVRILACLNHDDDHLLLWVFEGKNRRESYQSILDAPRFAWALSKFRGGFLTYPFVFAVLAWPIFIFQVFRHQALKKLLLLPSSSVGLGYAYLSKGEIPPNLPAEDIRQI